MATVSSGCLCVGNDVYSPETVSQSHNISGYCVNVCVCLATNLPPNDMAERCLSISSLFLCLSIE